MLTRRRLYRLCPTPLPSRKDQGGWILFSLVVPSCQKTFHYHSKCKTVSKQVSRMQRNNRQRHLARARRPEESNRKTSEPPMTPTNSYRQQPEPIHKERERRPNGEPNSGVRDDKRLQIYTTPFSIYVLKFSVNCNSSAWHPKSRVALEEFDWLMRTTILWCYSKIWTTAWTIPNFITVDLLSTSYYWCFSDLFGKVPTQVITN